ncbi:BTAD domain-containing putative transcriptional regulator [Arthrobacter alpinus]|nr:BTAD domain-containing putative transcriptional regulator [Arthrobacter alpinus]
MPIQILGDLRVDRGDAILGVQHLGGPKPRQVLEILLLQLGQPASKEKLIDLLWSGHPPAEAGPTLESKVSVLRRHLQPGAAKTGPLQTVNGGYVIEKSLVALDLEQFDTLLQLAHQSMPAQALPLLRQALALASGPLLDNELLPAWADEERARHATHVTEARILAAESATALLELDEALSWATVVLQGDQLNERAWTAFILALELAGRHSEGLQAYERCRRILHQELGCAPGQCLRDAQLRLLGATADGELSEVLSALLVVHEQIRRFAHPDAAVYVDRPASGASSPSLREAGTTIDAFLRRAFVLA